MVSLMIAYQIDKNTLLQFKEKKKMKNGEFHDKFSLEYLNGKEVVCMQEKNILISGLK